MGTNSELPEYLKTIYVLVADDELAKKENRRYVQGLIRGIAAMEPALDGWTVEVRTDDNPFLALMHVQVRPIDLILLDCRFEVKNPDFDFEEEWHRIRPFLTCMFAIRGAETEYTGMELIKYVGRARRYEAGIKDSKVTQSLDFSTVLFTSHSLSDLSEASEIRRIRLVPLDLDPANIDELCRLQAEAMDSDKENPAPITVPYLQKGDETLIKKLQLLLVNCRNRITKCWDKRESPQGKELYRVFRRFIAHKFAHHDWFPEYLQCLPAEYRIDRQELFRIPFKDQTLVFYSRGRTYEAPSDSEKGIFFAFPQSRQVECRPRNPEELDLYNVASRKKILEFFEKTISSKYNGNNTIEKVMEAFIKYFSNFAEKGKNDWTTQVIIHSGYSSPHPNGPAKQIGQTYLTRQNAYKIAGTSVQCPDLSLENHHFAGLRVISPIWLAATPLTGSSMTGPPDEVIEHYVDKIRSFVRGGYAVVLKTVYPLIESNRKWPEHSMHRTSQSRCYKVNPDENSSRFFNFYNTGSTALETFPPEMFHRCLRNLPQEKEDPIAIIPSLGAHKCDTKTWETLFHEVFGPPEELLSASFPLVEINARHAIRDLVDKARLGGDEYFHPLSTDFALSAAKLTSFYHGFEEWVRLVARLAQERRQKVIFKFPYRVDLFVLLSICNTLHYDLSAIGGVTLLNTFKSPLINKQPDVQNNREPIWKKRAGDPDYRFTLNGQEWFDIIKHPQVSGIYIKPLRNYILDALHDPKFIENGAKPFKLEISASGGVLSTDDIEECFVLGAQSVQIGTWFLNNFSQSVDKSLLDRVKAIKNEIHIYRRNRSLDKAIGGGKEYVPLVRRIVHFRVEKCGRCGNCYNSYYCDAFLNRRLGGRSDQSPWIPYNGQYYDLTFPILDENACVGCGVCVQLCPNDALELRLADSTATNGGVSSVHETGFAHYFSVNREGQPAGKRTVSTRKFILASSSERRKAILKSLGLRFKDIDPQVEEDKEAKEPEQRVLNNARMKVEAVIKRMQNASGRSELDPKSIIIGCDTVMVFKDGMETKILEKPLDDEDATRKLLELNGNSHTALTGLCVYDPLSIDPWREGFARTTVVFKNNDPNVIEWYVSTGEPLGKAGAYGIQGRGETLIDKIEGSYSNVVGLPKELLVTLLTEMGILPDGLTPTKTENGPGFAEDPLPFPATSP